MTFEETQQILATNYGAERKKPDTHWSQEREARLMKLWDQGLSCGGIARAMGITRNAAIGKVHRLLRRDKLAARMTIQREPRSDVRRKSTVSRSEVAKNRAKSPLKSPRIIGPPMVKALEPTSSPFVEIQYGKGSIAAD